MVLQVPHNPRITVKKFETKIISIFLAKSTLNLPKIGPEPETGCFGRFGRHLARKIHFISASKFFIVILRSWGTFSVKGTEFCHNYILV